MATRIKRIATIAAVVFAAVTAWVLTAQGQMDRLLLAWVSVILAMAPWALERLFRCEIRLPFYLFALLYTLGPMLGHSLLFYYRIPWWDKLLHTSAGVIFAVLGVFFFRRLSKGQESWGIAVLFGLCFSVAVAAVWEFAEFGADCFFGTDMQNDRVITHITSYLLEEKMGVTGCIDGICTVVIDGKALPVEGYVDIGLIDTMLDMLLESLGALVTCGILWLGKGKAYPIRG